jgi:hypothetical protein
MKRSLALVVVLLTLVVAMGVVVSAVQRAKDAGSGPVYTVAEVISGLAHKPKVWMGRTIRVRGVINATYCDVTAPCALSRLEPSQVYTVAGGGRFVLEERRGASDSLNALQRASLLLALGSADPLRSMLRRLPVLENVLLSTQQFTYGVPHIFRLRLQPRPCAWPGWWCVEGVLLDTVPPTS